MMSAATYLLLLLISRYHGYANRCDYGQVYYEDLQRFHDVLTPIVSFYEQHSAQNFISFVF
jgi:hypothetical protein